MFVSRHFHDSIIHEARFYAFIPSFSSDLFIHRRSTTFEVIPAPSILFLPLPPRPVHTFFLSCFICAGPFLLPAALEEGKSPERSIVGVLGVEERVEEEREVEEGREEKENALACVEREEGKG